MAAAGITRRGFLGTQATLAGLFAARASFAQEDGGAAPDLARFRERYDLAPGLNYLNHASIGTVPRAVRTAHMRYLEACESNPWLHIWGDAWQASREEVRALAATALGCSDDQLAITHNTTEGFNLLAQGLPLGAGDEVLFSSLNHDGASAAWQHRAEERGFTVRRFEFPLERALSAGDVVEIYANEIRDETRVLVFPHIDNILGVRHPLRELSKRAHESGVEFVAVDGAQSAGMIPIDFDRSGVDFFATSTHKWLQSPKELGLLAARAESREHLRPMWVTWGQQRWSGTVRAYTDYGTRDLPKLMALGDALRFHALIDDAQRGAYLRELRTHARARVDAVPHWKWRSPEDWDAGASLVAVEVAGDVNEVAAVLFDEHACVVRPFSGRGLGTLRVSPNLLNGTEDLDRFFDALDELT